MRQPRLQGFEALRRLELPQHDYAIFGSGPLIVRGIVGMGNDIDVVCRGHAWELVKAKGEVRYLEQYDVDIVEIDVGSLSFGTQWGIGDFDIDELIDTAEEIAGLPFVRLEHVVAYKRIANRAKDIAHLQALEAWLEKNVLR